MTYKYSTGQRKFDDIQFEGDANTEIDFEDDYIALEAAGNPVLVVSGSQVGIGTTTPTQILTLSATNPTIRFEEGGTFSTSKQTGSEASGSSARSIGNFYGGSIRTSKKVLPVDFEQIAQSTLLAGAHLHRWHFFRSPIN